MISFKLNSLLVYTFLIANLLNSCKTSSHLSYQVQPGTETINGLIPMTSIGYGSKNEEAIIQAEMNAFKAVFFRGLAGSSVHQPLLGTSESEIIAKHQPYFKKLFEGKRYQTFITQSNILSQEKIKGTRKAIVSLTINVNAIRKDLENAGVMRRFGL